MLAYAAKDPRPLERRSSPNAMLVIIAAHVAAVAALMSAKMDLQEKFFDPPTKIELIPIDTPPPPKAPEPQTPAQPQRSTLDQPKPLVPPPPSDRPMVDSTPVPPPTFDELIGPKELPKADPLPSLPPVKLAPRLLTSGAELKPPYPQAKLLIGEEAVLRLKLTIDERGRVVAVEPVGRADRTFLDAARRHLLSRWRYKPAMEGDRAVAASTVITLRFQLDG